MSTYPHIRVEGDATERGRQYGEQARERIERSLVEYRKIFKHYAGWDWSEVRAFATAFEAPIRAFSSKYFDEIVGIAEGAGLDPLDLLAINVRTEIMFSARASQAMKMPLECTAFGIASPFGSNDPVLIGQNWDWQPHAFETVVVLEARQDDGPHYVTVVEAGLLAKTGMNARGLGLVTNALATDSDRGAPGVPYHVLLRAILDCSTVSEALGVLLRNVRSSSANYLIGHRSGGVIDAEAAPGDFSHLYVLTPDDGLLVHTNHFLSPRFDGRDVSLWSSPSSPVRYARALGGLRQIKHTREDIELLLADHADYPTAVCVHPDLRLSPVEQGATVASVIMNLEEQTMWLADGPPCANEYRRLELAGLFSEGAR